MVELRVNGPVIPWKVDEIARFRRRHYADGRMAETFSTDLGIEISADGYITDYISGQRVKAGPEEIEATQVFSRRLVEELGYPKTQVRTRPQFHVKESPSGANRWPVDICVFRDVANLTYENAFIIVECKRKTKKEGERQLRLYLQNSFATIGVWFNGKDHLYLRKRILSSGEVRFEEIFTLPRHGQSLSDIGKLRRKDLTIPINLKATFNDIRNHLAGMARGTTQDIDFAKQITDILFCKIWDEQDKAPEDFVDFHCDYEEAPDSIKARITRLFEGDVKRERFSEVFDDEDHITLDSGSVAYIVGELQNYAVTEADREALGDAFEVFIGKTLKGPEGQFFTPRNVIDMMVAIADPAPDRYVLDPACGSGGFLIAALEHVWRKVEIEGERKSWSSEKIGSEKLRIATRYFRGCDKDRFLTKVTKAYMAIIGDGQGGIACENSLLPYADMNAQAQDVLTSGGYDYIFTNPPFGSKIKVEGQELLSQFELGHLWRFDAKTKRWSKTSNTPISRPPQILFIERCLDLLKPGGRLAIVLPESTFGNPSHRYILTYLRTRVKLLALVSMPEDLFQPYTHAKACVVVMEKTASHEQQPMFMGIVKWCGHDSRGNRVPHDDVPEIAKRYKQLSRNGTGPPQRFGFMKRIDEVVDNIFIPKYYDPEIRSDLAALESTHHLVTVGQLIREGALSPVSTGHEVGKLAYGTGEVPFIRTSDMANWELKIDPKQGVSESIAHPIAAKQRLQAQDILMVRDGTYLVGTSAMLTEDDLASGLIIQSHIYRLRVKYPDRISPFLLLALLNTSIVKRQIRSKQFTQDIIDTLGARIHELVLPIPQSKAIRDEIAVRTQRIIEARARLRKEAREVARMALSQADASVAKEELAEIL